MKRALIVLAMCAAPASAFAQGAPATVSFVARLQDAGLPLMGSHTFVFALFDQPTAGASLWTETRPNVALQDGGLLYLDLGSVTALDSTVFGGTAKYLEITIDNVVSSPRVLIESVPYALRASVATNASDSAMLAGHLPSFFQKAVINSCTIGQYITSIDPVTGGETCANDLNTTYTAGTGLTLTGSQFSVDTTMIQPILTSAACASGKVVQAIDAGTGVVTCIAQQTYLAGSGLLLTGNTFSADTTKVQTILTGGACTVGNVVQSINAATGAVTCTPAASSGITAASGRVDTTETRNSSAYGDLATVGPSTTVTIPASGNALITLTGQISPPSGGTGYMSFSGGGVAAADNQALIRDAGTSSSTGYVQASATLMVTGITAGSQTFTAKYRSDSASHTVTFLNRQIIVVPLP